MMGLSLNPRSLKGVDFWLTAYLLLIMVQFGRLPLWLSGVALAGGVAGWFLHRHGRKGIGTRWLGILAIGLAALFWVYYRGRFTVDTAASFLVLTVALKWLELRRRRDLFILFFILCYLGIVSLLFGQSIIRAGLLIVSLFLLFTGLQVALGAGVGGLSMPALRRSGWLFLKMLPIVALLFVFFPRVGPLWSVPMVSDQGRTGLSDEMTPGSVTRLVQNDERAFRVAFGGDTPPPAARYWQALILDRFDGQTWSRREPRAQKALTRVPQAASASSLARDQYEILIEPHGRRWGFALDGSVPASASVQLDPRGLVRFERPVDTQTRYRMQLGQAQPRQLPSRARRFYTALPSSGNERARQWVREQRQKTESREALIRRLMHHFREAPFHYTLEPPKLGEDPVDELMFDTRAGFCEHYASALAFMLRSAGIPARIMTGYLGGESGLNDEYLIVRQYDAHAWVQAWLPGRGWFRLDPTSRIAPERIEQGLEAALRDEGSFLRDNLFSPSRYRDIGWVNWVRLRLDAVNYYWQRWIVGYEGRTQLSLFERLPGNIGFRELGLITAGSVACVILGAVAFSVLRQRGRRFRDPWLRLYDQWRRWLRKRGVPVSHCDTVSAQVEALVAAVPSEAVRIRRFGAILNRVFYAPDRIAENELTTARELFARIRRHTGHGRSRHGAAAQR